MIDSKSDCEQDQAHEKKPWWTQYGVLAITCVLVLGVYAYTAHSGYSVPSKLNPASEYYNLLVQGFRAGQLNAKIEVPPGLAQLADPYDPGAHSKYPVLDMSYYKGKLYLYFGVTPALLLFWPYVAMTGHYLPQTDAAIVFCFVGFLVSVGLLHALWRRYFTAVSVVVIAAGALALGLVTYVPALLARFDIHEVSISCGYALSMIALGAIWKALHGGPKRRSWWLAMASLAFGLAVGARPALLFGAVILLVPVVQAWREQGPIRRVLAAALGPITLVGLGLMLYNFLRFDNPLEFGWRYQLTYVRQFARLFFSPRFLWFNLRVYFLEPVCWGTRFPYVREAVLPSPPAGYGQVMSPLGLLTDVPVVWLALAVPLAWRSRSSPAKEELRWFVMAAVLLFGMSALTLGLFCDSNPRYVADFLPVLVLLAAIGNLSLERALAIRTVPRQAMRWVWSLLLCFSMAFNLLLAVGRRAEAHYGLGRVLFNAGNVPDSIAQFEQALRLQPDFADAHNNLGVALQRADRTQEAIGHFERALRLNPNLAVTHCSLGEVLLQQGKVPEAVGHLEQALRLQPDLAEAHNDLGAALWNGGNVQEAIVHFKQAVRINPDYAEAHYNLGIALEQASRVQEAIGHYEQALRLNPSNAIIHNDLGTALEKLGRRTEAISHFEQAVRIKPDFVEAQSNLARARSVQ